MCSNSNRGAFPLKSFLFQRETLNWKHSEGEEGAGATFTSRLKDVEVVVVVFELVEMVPHSGLALSPVFEWIIYNSAARLPGALFPALIDALGTRAHLHTRSRL